MPVSRAFPDAVTVVDDTELYELGTEWFMDSEEAVAVDSTVAGPQLWVYVFNDETSTAWAKGTVVAVDAATANYDGIVAAVDTPSNRLLGVAQHAIAAGKYGWILARGIGHVLAGTETIDVNEGVYVSSATAGAGMEAGTAVIAAGSTITEAHLAGPFAWATANALAAATALCFIQIR
jgi:hypothetical protein